MKWHSDVSMFKLVGMPRIDVPLHKLCTHPPPLSSAQNRPRDLPADVSVQAKVLRRLLLRHMNVFQKLNDYLCIYHLTYAVPLSRFSKVYWNHIIPHAGLC